MNSSKVQILDSFLSPAECSAIVEQIESMGFDNQFSGDGRLLRSRAQFEHFQLSLHLWTRLKPSLPRLTEIYGETFKPEPAPKRALESYVPVQLNERFRCYRYGSDEEFRRHQDFAHEYSDSKRTFLTVLVYLNAGYAGGETLFEHVRVCPKLGMLAFFPHELEHEGCKVLSGMKYTLRTDVVYESIS